MATKKRKPRPTKPDSAANMFAIAVTPEGAETGIARIETLTYLREHITENMKAGLFTEVVILNIRQLDPVVKRIIG